jgi:hypothetical protein
MTDLDELIRSTLNQRHDDTKDIGRWTPPVSPAHRRRWVPLMAAAIGLLIVGTVVGARLGLQNPHRNAQPAAAPAAPAIPKGMKAISAYGVEIFVPKTAWVDVTCMSDISTPLWQPAMTSSAPSCPLGTPKLGVSISTDPISPDLRCTERIIVAGTSQCLYRFDAALRTPSEVMYSAAVHWHGVTITSGTPTAVTLAIMRSLHAADPDRSGCSAHKIDLQPTRMTRTSATDLLQTGAVRADVCWYANNALIGSHTLNHIQSASLIGYLNGLASSWPGIQQPKLLSCGAAAKTGGVVLTATYPGGGTEQAVVDVVPCNGQPTATNGLADRLSPTAQVLYTWADMGNR